MFKTPISRILMFVVLLAGTQACGPSYKVIDDNFRTLRKDRGTKQYQKKWAKIKKAKRQKRYQKALRITQRLFKKARRQNNPAQIVKTLQKAHELRKQATELKPDFAFGNLKAVAESKDFLTRSLGQAMLAERYHEAHQAIRKAMMKPNDQLPVFSNPLMATWSSDKFHLEINKAWRKALAPRAQLTKLYAGVFDPVLAGNPDLRPFRPSVFDLLAYKALSHYQQGDDLPYTKALEYRQGLFALPHTYHQMRFEGLSGDQHYRQSFRIFRAISLAHWQDSVYEALTHVTLERLQFAYKHVALPKSTRTLRYYKGLDSLRRAFPSNPAKAMVLFRQAKLINQGFEPPEGAFSLQSKAVALCEKAVNRYPGSPGAKRCRVLLNHLKEPALGLKVQKRYLPYRTGRMRLSYKNVDSLFYHFIPIPSLRKPGLEKLPENKLAKRLLNRPSAYRLNAQLPLFTLYETTSKKIGVPALKRGTYAILAGSKPDLSNGKGLRSIHFFQVSRIATLPVSKAMDTTSCLRLVDAQEGSPLKQARIIAYEKDAEGNLQTAWSERYKSTNKGRICWPQARQTPAYLAIVHENDTLLVSYGSLQGPEHPDSNYQLSRLHINKTTYQPGEDLVFHGTLKKPNAFRQNPLNLPPGNQSFEVFLLNEQNDTLSSKKLVSDPCGSFRDSLPVPLLAGKYRLATPFTETHLMVKPLTPAHFNLQISTGDRFYSMNHEVKVKGEAHAFQSIPIPYEKLQYQVWRTVSFPYSQKPDSLPPYATSRIITDTTLTGRDGTFQFQFKTKSWPGMQPYTSAVYQYKITAQLFQPEGPTLRTSSTVRASQQQHFLQLHAPAWLRKPDQQKPLKAELHNVRGKRLEKPVTLKLFRLRRPKKLFRKQYWPIAQFQSASAKAFQLKFPHDPYGSNPLEARKSTVADTTWVGKIPANQNWFLPDSLIRSLKVGSYKAKLVCPSENLFCQSTAEGYFKVYDTKSSKAALKQYQYLAPAVYGASQGSPVSLYGGSAAKNVHGFCSVKGEPRSWLDTLLILNHEQATIKIDNPITDPTRISLKSVKHNRLYHNTSLVFPPPDSRPGKTQPPNTKAFTRCINQKPKTRSIPPHGAFGISQKPPSLKPLTFDPINFESLKFGPKVKSSP